MTLFRRLYDARQAEPDADCFTVCVAALGTPRLSDISSRIRRRQADHQPRNLARTVRRFADRYQIKQVAPFSTTFIGIYLSDQGPAFCIGPYGVSVACAPSPNGIAFVPRSAILIAFEAV